MTRFHNVDFGCLNHTKEHFLSSKIKWEAISSSSYFHNIPDSESQKGMCQNEKLLGNKKTHKALLSNQHSKLAGFDPTYYFKMLWSQTCLDCHLLCP
jgi:hypothetical protein